MKHTTRSLVAVMFALGLGACADDAPGTGVDSNAICDCTPQTAATVAYDNNGSALADTNVQGAVDELAARAEGLSDAWGRITLEEFKLTLDSPATEAATTVDCVGGAKPLGGACSSNNSDVSVESFSLSSGGFSCVWNKPANVSIEFTAQVTCLAKAE